MALFNEDGLKKKLDDLNMSQQSIQTLSLWLIHHKKHADSVVNTWVKELINATDTRKLTFMYLANDVIQNSKKKGPEYNKEFSKRLAKVFEHLATVQLDDKSKRGLQRLIAVWEEREVFSSSIIYSFKRSYEGLTTLSSQPSSRSITRHAAKRRRRSGSVSIISDEDAESGVDSDDAEEGEQEDSSHRGDASSPMSSPSDKPRPAPTPLLLNKPPPDPEKLIEALQALETAATGDAEVREKISNLPTEVTDSASLAKLKDSGMGRALQAVVVEALDLLTTYNGRLAEEMEARKAVARMLHDSILHQKDKLAQTEEMLEEYRQKVNKILKIKADLKNHLQNLPDISRLPNMSANLAPLPSAGDLFTN